VVELRAVHVLDAGELVAFRRSALSAVRHQADLDAGVAVFVGHAVAAFAAVDGVGATAALDDVVAAAGKDDVLAVGAEDLIGAVGYAVVVIDDDSRIFVRAVLADNESHGRLLCVVGPPGPVRRLSPHLWDWFRGL